MELDVVRAGQRFKYAFPDTYEIVDLQAVSAFHPKECFLVGDNSNRVTFSEIQPGFQKAFLDGDEKVERNVVSARLRIYRACSNAHEKPVIDLLNANRAVEVSLAHIHMIIERYCQVQSGVQGSQSSMDVLHFYARDLGNRLHKVRCFYRKETEGWRINAFPCTDSLMWRYGDAVVFPWSNHLEALLAVKRHIATPPWP